MKKIYVKPIVEEIRSTLVYTIATSIANGNEGAVTPPDVDDSGLEVGAKDWNGWDD